MKTYKKDDIDITDDELEYILVIRDEYTGRGFAKPMMDLSGVIKANPKHTKERPFIINNFFCVSLLFFFFFFFVVGASKKKKKREKESTFVNDLHMDMAPEREEDLFKSLILSKTCSLPTSPPPAYDPTSETTRSKKTTSFSALYSGISLSFLPKTRRRGNVVALCSERRASFSRNFSSNREIIRGGGGREKDDDDDAEDAVDDP